MFRIALFLVVGWSSVVARAEPPGTDGEAARRLAAILDYVAGDYGGAVRGGAIVAQDEYAEQLGFLEDAGRLARQLPPTTTDVPARIDGLLDAAHRVESPERLGADARALRAEVILAYDVAVAPLGPPTRDRAAASYAERCSVCHGANGAADTATARTLDPPPRNFLDDEVMSGLTPTRAFNALTDGVSGTAMPSFATLSSSERWDLAFYVFGLRFDDSEAARGAGAAPELGLLADSSERELRRQEPGLSETQWRTRAAWLRRSAPYAVGAPLESARRGLASGLAALDAGDRASARQLVGEAYLAGFEPHEESLRQTDPALVVEIEQAFLAVRDATPEGDPARVHQEARRLEALLDRAEGALSGGHGGRAAFVGAALVVVREGVEAALLVLLILAMQGRAGASRRRLLWVHAGWIAALVAGGALWMASDALIAFAGASRELLEGAVTLLAAVVMVLASHWILARIDATRRVSALRRDLAERAVPAWTLATMSFAAVFREAFEVVLFLKAIALDAGGGVPLFAGAGFGVLLLVAFVAASQRLGRRLQPAPLLTGAGALLCLMAVVFVGKGLRSLQEAGVVGIHDLGTLRFDLLGVYPTVETLAGQVVLVVVLLATLATPARAMLRARRASRGADAQAAAK